MNTLKETYYRTIVPTLQKQLAIANKMSVPKLVKIVVNCGLGEALKDKKVIDQVAAQLAAITGQKPKVTKAAKAISTFKLRAGDSIGLKVTLRGNRMYDFFMKFVGIALPRVRDFRGVSARGFDEQGNYTLGLKEQIIFPELEYKLVDRIRGFEITFVTSAKDAAASKALLSQLGMPFETVRGEV